MPSLLGSCSGTNGAGPRVAITGHVAVKAVQCSKRGCNSLRHPTCKSIHGPSSSGAGLGVCNNCAYRVFRNLTVPPCPKPASAHKPAPPSASFTCPCGVIRLSWGAVRVEKSASFDQHLNPRHPLEILNPNSPHIPKNAFCFFAPPKDRQGAHARRRTASFGTQSADGCTEPRRARVGDS